MTWCRLRWRSLLFSAAVAVQVFAMAPQASAGEAYYVLVFGQQQTPNNVNASHTFATFVKLSWAGSDPRHALPRLEAHTISWLPAAMQLHALAVLPEYGRNLDLHATLRWAQENGMRTSLWGPYAIRPELYQAALREISLLQSGQVLYKVNDLGYRSDEVCNCIHALNSVVLGHHYCVFEPGWGEAASYRMLCRMRPWIMETGTIHAWVGSALGLDCYPIVYRDWSPPHSGPIAGPVFRLLGGEMAMNPSYGRIAR
jgi:hypothetical protein